MRIEDISVHLYTLRRKQLKKSEKLSLEDTKAALSAGNVMASAFWGAKGVITVDYVAKDETINSAYYCTLCAVCAKKLKKNARDHSELLFTLPIG